jgi:hypothetical protein
MTHYLGYEKGQELFRVQFPLTAAAAPPPLLRAPKSRLANQSRASRFGSVRRSLELDLQHEPLRQSVTSV